MKRTMVVVIVGVVFNTLAFAQGTVGFELLRMEATARSAAAMGTLVAVPGEVDAMESNPATLADVAQPWVSLTYLKHLLDFNSGTIGYAMPVKNWGTMGARITYFDYGSFDEATPLGEITGRTFGANDMLFSASFARSVGPVFRLGGSLNFIWSKIDEYSASALGVNIGFPARTKARIEGIHEVVLGGAVYNLGAATKAFVTEADKLPLGFRGGLSAPLEYLPLTLMMQVTKWVDEDVHFALAGEFKPADVLRVRVAYSTEGREQRVDSNKDAFAGLSAGFGLLFREYRFDYALSSFGELGILNRFTISRHF
jgi:hypothetical protein